MAASRVLCGIERKIEREAIIIVGKVIKARTIPPTSGVERGKLKKFKKTAKPNRPNTMDGTAARLLMFTSIKLVRRVFLAYSSR